MKKPLKIVLRVIGILLLLVIAWRIADKILHNLDAQRQANVGLANPASVYCEQQSGTLEMVTDASGAQSGICHLVDGTTCDEWAYFRGECPTTGIVETTGNTLSWDQQKIIDYYTYLQNHEFDKAAEMKTGNNSSAANLEKLYKTATKITITKITTISSWVYQINLTYEEPCVQDTYVVKKEIIDGKINDISSKKISSADVWATWKNIVKIENNFMCFFADRNTEIEWPQSSKFQALWSPVFAFSVVTWGNIFMSETDKSWLFFDDPFGTQWWIKLPIKTWSDQANFLGNLARSLQFKITDKSEYTKAMKSAYPDFNVKIVTPTSTNTKMTILNSNYSKDANHVYLDGNIVAGINPKTVKSLWNVRYIKDDKSVYRWPKKIEGADPATFVILLPGDGVFTKDKNHVYKDWDILKGADAASFESFNSFDNNTVYKAKDKNHVYDRDGNILPWIDGGSFEMLSNEWLFAAKDKNHVYNGFLMNGIIQWVDPATFVFVGHNYGKDSTHVFYYPSAGLFSVVEWADPATFEETKLTKTSGWIVIDAQDKNNKYSGWTIVQ